MDQPEISCPNCGAPNPVGVAVCERCGSALPQPSATLKLDPGEVFPGGNVGKATLRVEPEEVPGFGPSTGQPMETMRVESEEIPPPSPPIGADSAFTPAMDFAPPPPPVAQPPKKSNRNVIIGVVVGVFACLCLCCCALVLIVYNLFSNGGISF